MYYVERVETQALLLRQILFGLRVKAHLPVTLIIRITLLFGMAVLSEKVVGLFFGLIVRAHLPVTSPPIITINIVSYNSLQLGP